MRGDADEDLKTYDEYVLRISVLYCVCCRDMFCAGRVPDEDLKRTMKACGGSIQTTAQQLTEDVLGQCEVFEEEQIGGERSVRIIDYTGLERDRYRKQTGSNVY